MVTSSYAPTTIADMHRARHLAWELPELGWEVEVLCPNLDFQRPEYLDPASGAFFNPQIVTHQVAPLGSWLFRLLRMRSIGWRALWPLHRAGAALLSSKRFDLIYITTGNFVFFCLARGWTRKFNVPCVLDYHDPWVRDRIRYDTTDHTLKLRVSAWLSSSMERWAVKGASGIVSVSSVYLDELRSRYPGSRCLEEQRCQVIPFAGREGDMNGLGRAARTGRQSSGKSFTSAPAAQSWRSHLPPSARR